MKKSRSEFISIIDKWFGENAGKLDDSIRINDAEKICSMCCEFAWVISSIEFDLPKLLDVIKRVISFANYSKKKSLASRYPYFSIDLRQGILDDIEDTFPDYIVQSVASAVKAEIQKLCLGFDGLPLIIVTPSLKVYSAQEDLSTNNNRWATYLEKDDKGNVSVELYVGMTPVPKADECWHEFDKKLFDEMRTMLNERSKST